MAAGALLALRFETGPETAPVETAVIFAQSFNDANGDLQPMDQWQRRLLVVNFWATWCAPCIEEMPDLQKVQVEYAARGVTTVGIAIDNASAVKRFRDEQNVGLPLLVQAPPVTNWFVNSATRRAHYRIQCWSIAAASSCSRSLDGCMKASYARGWTRL